MPPLQRTLAVLIGSLAFSFFLSAAEPPSQKFVCSGSEPFWRLEADGTAAQLTRPAEQGIVERAFEGRLGRADYLQPPWTVWRGVETKEPATVLVATIREESCQDSMSGAAFEPRVILSLPVEEPLAGCCRLIAQEAQPSPAGPLESELHGRRWLLERVEGREISGSPRPFITFTSDGKVTGNAGCNQFGGQAQVSGNSIRLGPLIATRRACVDQERMNIEQRFLEALERAHSWRVDRDRLVLLNQEGTAILRFERQAE